MKQRSNSEFEVVDGNTFMVSSTNELIEISFSNTHAYELSHERARVLAETILTALRMWE